jgi:dTDP-4-dehydrorhamnose reductase
VGSFNLVSGNLSDKASSNILDALTMKESGVFYTAGSADPRNFVARFIPSKRLNQQYELVSSTTGEPMVGITVASFVRSTLRGDAPDGAHYREFAVIPHKGIYERFVSFHCLNFGVTRLKGQRVRNIVSFQTRARSDDGECVS